MNTNRRNFLSSIITAAVAPLILPSATTYKRIWKEIVGEEKYWAMNPDYFTAEYEIAFYYKLGSWTPILLTSKTNPFDKLLKRVPYPIKLGKNGKIIPPIIEQQAPSPSSLCSEHSAEDNLQISQ